MNCLLSGVNILAGGSSVPLISECKGTDPPLEARALQTLRLIARQPWRHCVTSLRSAHWLASSLKLVVRCPVSRWWPSCCCVVNMSGWGSGHWESTCWGTPVWLACWTALLPSSQVYQTNPRFGTLRDDICSVCVFICITSDYTSNEIVWGLLRGSAFEAVLLCCRSPM